MRKKPNLPERMDACAEYQIKNPEDFRGKWSEKCFPGAPLHVEVGCGKGRFTAGTAEAIPDALLVAVEIVPDAMVMAMEAARAKELKNVRYIHGDAKMLEQFFAEGEVERIYLNFSDPWPHNRHAKRRLTYPTFLESYKKLLVPGGQIHFKTDNSPLFEYSVRQFEKCGYALSEVTRDLHANGPVGIMTDYEIKFSSQGYPINRCVATKI
ncbi:MAG: tRNA (guanosine(46)-N7)-methyltransferase TrmB [Oscillospiraceae bacterium]|nr:tRNA (guanosine(46)-N7)-methyltransferase TrmB [Oscillospiraceae bacterium]